jgi:chemotaxis signal transduction protein
MSENGGVAKLEELKRSFDRAFQDATIERELGLEHLLRIRVGTERFAVRVAELAGLMRTPTIVRLPTTVTGLLGLAGVKGRMVAMYSLGALLECQKGDGEEEYWSILCRFDDRIAFTFAAADGTLTVSRSELCPISSGAPAHVTDTVGAGAARRWLLGLSWVAQAVADRTQAKPASRTLSSEAMPGA